MTESPASDPAGNPPPLTVAASLVAVQGVVLVALSVAELASVSSARLGLGLSTAGFLAVYGVLLLVAGWGLHRRLTWVRGPVLLTQLISLGLAWNLRDQPLLAVVLAVVALVVLAGMLHRDSVEALQGPVTRDDS